MRQGAQILAIEEGLAGTPPSKDAMPAALARIGTARRIIEMDDDKTGRELAVRYQLMSQWTNYVVVHARTDTEKAEDLPKIVRVPQVLAAGWHGMGTVHGQEMFDACYKVSRHAYSQPTRMKFAGAIDPALLVALLNAHAMSSPPTLNDLETWGAPEAVLVVLRDLVGRGVDEAKAVAVFLYLLATTEAGNALDRPVRRRILRAYKTATLDQAVIDPVTYAFDSWKSQGAADGIGR